jgi:hypothetical protein
MKINYVVAFCLASALLSFYLSSCGKANGGGIRHAEIIPSQDGATCYGIFDSDGSLKGGNCK